MGAVSRTLRKTSEGYAHWCPACNQMHTIRERGPFVQPPSWDFNQDVQNPTFHPSVRFDHPAKDGVPPYTCHYHIVGGYIVYCNDCTHSLRGQTVALPFIAERPDM